MRGWRLCLGLERFKLLDMVILDMVISYHGSSLSLQ
jgi:hypothetical protein